MSNKYYTETLQKGSQGESVKEWQKFLVSQGYDLGVDGIFGDKTHYYTKRYQQKNGLNTDGVVGQYTWGAAGYTSADTPVSKPTTSPSPTNPTFNNTNFSDTDVGQTALQNKETAENAVKNYGQFSWQNEGQAKELWEKMMNRPDFSYDFNADALYQQYKDKHIQQGKMAMADTMGQAAAMTGGYGNSYAQSVGQQAYQASLDNLNDIIPELYQMAYNRYQQEGQDMKDRYGMLMDDHDRAYGKWNDGYNKLVGERDYTNSDFYNQEGSYNADRDNANNLAQNNYANEFQAWLAENDEAWKQAQWDEEARRYANEEAWRQKEYELQKKSINSSNSSSGSGGSGGNGNKTTTTTPAPAAKPNEEAASDYADFDAGDWEAYFAYIRQTDGRAAAEEELNRMTRAGLIPKNKVTYAATGARGGAKGH